MRRAVIAVAFMSGLLSCADRPTAPEDPDPQVRPLATYIVPAAVERPAPPPPTHSSDPAPPPERPSTLALVFVGDVVLGEYGSGSKKYRSFAGPEAPADPFVSITAALRADVVVGNLESPVMFERPARSPLRRGHRFGASASAVDVLAGAGFDVMSVANNHANDLGRAGLEQTPLVLRDRGLLPAGAARSDGASPFVVETLEQDGWRLGFLSAATLLNNIPDPDDPRVPLVRTSALPEALGPVLTAARDDHDLLVVLVHWGRERREAPSPTIVRTAHALVDAGADLVIGHHPHVLQGIEHYRGGLIAYSLGNFLFPSRDPEFRDSGVLRVRWDMRARCPRAIFEAVRLDRAPGHAPQPAAPKERHAIFDRVQRLGRALQTRWRDEGATLTMDGCRAAANSPDSPDNE